MVSRRARARLGQRQTTNLAEPAALQCSLVPPELMLGQWRLNLAFDQEAPLIVVVNDDIRQTLLLGVGLALWRIAWQTLFDNE